MVRNTFDIFYPNSLRMQGKPTNCGKGPNLSSPKPGHTTGGSGRGGARAGRLGGAGQDRTPTHRSAQDTTDPLADQGFAQTCPERFFQKHKQRKTVLCNPTGGQNQRLTTCSLIVESKTRTYHGRVGSGRGAERRGGVGQNSSPRKQASLLPPKASMTRRLNVSPEARTSEIV